MSALTIEDLINYACERGASDLHLSSNQRNVIRVRGELQDIPRANITNRQLKTWLEANLDELKLEELERDGDVDFALDGSTHERLRISVYSQQGELAVAVRILNSIVPTFDEIGLPEVVRSWSARQTGLVIVTGPTGSGKSTTVSSLVNSINISRSAHILTIEDPIETIYPAGSSIVHQRELNWDTSSYPRAVRAALREDVDVLVLGEMRDPETISAALAVAETGHLVFATLHTPGAPHAIDRVIDAFDAREQPLIRSRLAGTLIGVVYQRLIPASTAGRIAVFEVLVANNAVRNLIREGKTHQIPNTMSTGQAEGMQELGREILKEAKEGRITEAVAQEFLTKN